MVGSKVLVGLAAFWKRARARLTSRPDTEHEQAIVRVLVVAVLCAYLSPGALARGDHATLGVMFAYLAVSIVLVLMIIASPAASASRRIVAAAADNGVVTWCMAFLGEHAAPLLLVYIWITLANGFRFGQRYLLLSLGFSACGFVLVLAISPFWQEHLVVGYGLLVGLVALSLYVRSLVTKLFDAIGKAEAANLAKRRFISVVSHEMRTPLNAIIGMADLLRDTSLTREQADMLQTLRSSSRLMLGLVDDVLDFSKIEAGKVMLEKADFDLHALVNSTARIVGAQAAVKGIEFVASIMPEVPPAVRGDPHYLRQVLINLAGNAVKFTERGSVTVHVSAQAETPTSTRVKFSVRDTGIGISPEAQARIFDSFTQADESTTRRFGGTGLGTTIAKQLVELMGGKIGLESAVGLGSTFWFEIPLEKQAEREEAGTGELSGARILLVGFPDGERLPLEQALSGWGAKAISVAQVEEGVQRLIAEISLAKPYQSALLYTDSGDLGLAQRFRRAAPHPAPPVVLAVPRHAGVQRFAALSAGFSSVMELPLDKRLLFNILHSVSAGEEMAEGVVRLQDYARRGTDSRKLQILVADDNPTNREVLSRILERAGHGVTLVNDGEQALDAVEDGGFDLAILDRNMPGTGGIEALQVMRPLLRGRERLPVIILSADVTPEVRVEAMEAGADAFLPKPIEAMRLLEHIRALCDSEPQRDAKSVPPAPSRPVPTGAAECSVNAETLLRLEELGSSPAFLERLVSVFLSDGKTLLERIEQALAGRNYREVRAVLHALKGSSASLGTDRLTSLCGRFGKLSDAELRLQTGGVVSTLSREMEQAQTELERYLQDRRQSTG